MTLWGVFFFFLGGALGSFINVLVSRYGTNESAFRGRSHCESCGRGLEWFELIPIASFLFLRGRCRTCRAAIPLRTMVAEFLAAGLFVVLGSAVLGGVLKLPFDIFFALQSAGWSFLLLRFLAFGFYAVFLSLALAIAVYDFEHFIIPRLFLLPLFLLGLGLNAGAALIAGRLDIVTIPLFAAGLAYLIFFSLWFFSRGRAMGRGDAELAAVFPFFLDPAQVMLALILSFLVGAAVGLIFVVLKKLTLKSRIPFGPFLVLGAVVSLFFGSGILKWYFGIFA